MSDCSPDHLHISAHTLSSISVVSTLYSPFPLTSRSTLQHPLILPLLTLFFSSFSSLVPQRTHYRLISVFASPTRFSLKSATLETNTAHINILRHQYFQDQCSSYSRLPEGSTTQMSMAVSKASIFPFSANMK
jgi:hypothetical protein